MIFGIVGGGILLIIMGWKIIETYIRRKIKKVVE